MEEGAALNPKESGIIQGFTGELGNRDLSQAVPNDMVRCPEPTPIVSSYLDGNRPRISADG